MQTQSFRFVVCSIIASLTFLNLAVVSSPASGENGAHFCGFTGQQPDNRRFARSLANLNVGEPRTVRMIYFTPNDWPYRAEVVQKMKDTIRTVQTFYAEQMNMQGYGKVTFRVESDPQGEPMVNHVDGQHPFSYYDNTLGSEVLNELQQAFDMRANIYFIVLGTDALRQGNGQPALGVGYNLGKNGGPALVANEFSWDLVAHELGHGFGLGHDFRDGAYIMSYGARAAIGPRRSQLSACAAEFLSLHPYFNSDIPFEVGEAPTIKLISPRRYPSGSMSVPVRLQVNDSEGVHQVLLSAQGGLQACRRLKGNRNGVAEFKYDGGFDIHGFTRFSESKVHTILVHAVDAKGNVSDTFFTLAEESPHHIDTLEGHVKGVRSVSFSEEGILASGSWDTTLRLWDVTTRQNVATLPHRGPVDSVVFSHDGILASGAGPALWDVERQQNIANFRHGGWVYSVSFSPDGKTLASGGGDGKVKLWDVVTEQIIDTLTHGDHVFSVSFSRNGLLASGSEDRTVKLWDVAAREQIAALPHENIVLSVIFSIDGRTLVSGGWGNIELWDVTTESRLDTLKHGATVSSVSFSPDGETLASGGWDGIVKLWDVTTRQEFATFGPTSPVESVTFSPDGRTIASGTAEGTIELWDVSGLTEVRLEVLTEINIPDPNLRDAILTALGKSPSTSVVRANMINLTLLEARNADISDLTGLEGATNLKTLNLDAEYIVDGNRRINSNSVSDLSPLAGLTKMTSLNVRENDLSNISALADLIGLRELYLDSNRISDISPVSKLTNLSTLSLGSNAISDISAVAGLIDLENLHLWGNSISDISAVAGLTNLTSLTLHGNNISDISAVAGLTNLTSLTLHGNNISDISAAAGLTNLTWLSLLGNNISDISPLVENIGLQSGDRVSVNGSPLNYASIYTYIPALQERGVEVFYDSRTPQRILSVSGHDQEGQPRAALEKPFIVEVLDKNNSAFAGVPVTFAVTAGGGKLSAAHTTTDENGRAESTLTLGQNPGTNTVEVTVTGVQGKQTFTAEGILIPKTFVIISGENQQGLPGAPLVNPFVVEILDPSDNPLPGVQVTFSVTSGGGRLSATTTTTDSDGQAESTLTLGPNLVTNTVEVTVTGVQGKQTFTAEGVRTPKAFWIIYGFDQKGLVGEALPNPIVVEVRDQSGEPVPGAEVTFSVTSGGGTLSATSATTDSDGSAESTLTLGQNPGTNTVEVTVTGVQGKQTFTAEGILIPKTFVIISGENQQGLPGAPLVNPFVVEILDPSDNPLPGVQVTFSVTSGGGRLSATTLTTDSDGRAENTLTLGPNPGANTVTVSVAGIQEEITVTAEGIRTPKAFWIIYGFDQKGLVGEALPNPIVVEVRNQSGEPFPGAEVTFSVTSGGGRLSVTSATTDSHGRAESTLTLGPDPGTNSVDVTVFGIQQRQIATAIAELPPILEDVNRDDVVNILDLVFVASALGDEGTDLAVDVNGDGIVNILDLVLVAGALGNAAAAPSAWYCDLEIAPIRADVGEWLAQAQRLDLTDATSQRGVLFLEQLLATLIPEETVLLPNYPNPFNPETWIPYRLAEDAFVTLTIYDARGRVVRALEIGHQAAAFYESRSNAIYWDGKNEIGEEVASGMYIYHLSAGGYSATRKMLIVK